jgi:hypothetical protein
VSIDVPDDVVISSTAGVVSARGVEELGVWLLVDGSSKCGSTSGVASCGSS